VEEILTLQSYLKFNFIFVYIIFYLNLWN